MSLLILSAVSYLPKAPLSLPLAVSFGFRNVLAPRYGMREIELDSTVLLDLLLTVDTFRYVRNLNLYVPSLNQLMHDKTLPRIAEKCVYLEELSLVIVFISIRRKLVVEQFEGIKDMSRLEYFRITAPEILSFPMLRDIAPPHLRTYVCGNAVFSGDSSQPCYFSDLPRSLTSVDISNVRCIGYEHRSLASLVDLPERLVSLNLTRCQLIPGGDGVSYDFSLLPRRLENARLSGSTAGETIIGKHWESFPGLLINLDLSSCGLSNALSDEFTCLPVYLRTLSLRDNKLTVKDGQSGLNLTLPETLVEFDISHNSTLEGVINFHQLPSGLKIFKARGCRFNQSLTEPSRQPGKKATCLADLPPSLAVLDLSAMPGISTSNGENPLLFGDLPQNLQSLDLTETSVQGHVDFTLLPPTLRTISIFDGNLSNDAVRTGNRSLVKLCHYDATAEKEVQKKQRQKYALDMAKRKKEGILRFSDIPTEYFGLSGNC